MNWDLIEGKWNEVKGKAQQQWGKLTDDDIEQAKGKKDELIGKIQARYGKTKEEAREELERWADSL